jgi:phage head maturation protease
MLLQHNASDLIGVWDEIAEDGKGLRVKGRLLTAVTKAREAYELVKAGALDGLSIGYRVGKSLDRNGRRVILEADLWEVSLVSFPMNEAARIDAVKTVDLTADQCRELEADLRMKGLSRTDAVKAVSGLKDWLRREVGGADSGARDERGPGIDDLVRFMRENMKGANNG